MADCLQNTILQEVRAKLYMVMKDPEKMIHLNKGVIIIAVCLLFVFITTF